MFGSIKNIPLNHSIITKFFLSLFRPRKFQPQQIGGSLNQDRLDLEMRNSATLLFLLMVEVRSVTTSFEKSLILPATISGDYRDSLTQKLSKTSKCDSEQKEVQRRIST
jgi:hypothetical protein